MNYMELHEYIHNKACLLQKKTKTWSHDEYKVLYEISFMTDECTPNILDEAISTVDKIISQRIDEEVKEYMKGGMLNAQAECMDAPFEAGLVTNEDGNWEIDNSKLYKEYLYNMFDKDRFEILSKIVYIEQLPFDYKSDYIFKPHMLFVAYAVNSMKYSHQNLIPLLALSHARRHKEYDELDSLAQEQYRKKFNISQSKSKAALIKHEKCHGSWEAFVKNLYENNDWTKIEKGHIRNRRMKYIKPRLQDKINKESWFNGYKNEGVSDLWITSFLGKEYESAKE